MFKSLDPGTKTPGEYLKPLVLTISPAQRKLLLSAVSLTGFIGGLSLSVVQHSEYALLVSAAETSATYYFLDWSRFGVLLQNVKFLLKTAICTIVGETFKILSNIKTRTKIFC